jgi:cytochrome b561
VPLKNTVTKYGAITKLFHWAVFILFVGQYTTATIMNWLDPNATLFGIGNSGWVAWHKSVGLLVFGIVLLRMIWRKTTRLPDWASGLSAWEKAAIHFVENGLYAVMILMPLTGLLMSAAGGHPTPFFNLFAITGFSHPNRILATTAWFMHIIISYVIVALVAVHVAMAVRRHLFEKDRYIKRML